MYFQIFNQQRCRISPQPGKEVVDDDRQVLTSRKLCLWHAVPNLAPAPEIAIGRCDVLTLGVASPQPKDHTAYNSSAATAPGAMYILGGGPASSMYTVALYHCVPYCKLLYCTDLCPASSNRRFKRYTCCMHGPWSSQPEASHSILHHPSNISRGRPSCPNTL